MKIGNILRKRRKMLGKTLEDIAYAAETDAGNLSRIERNEQRPSLELLEAISKALLIQLSELYRMAEEQEYLTRETASPYTAIEADPQLDQLLRHYHQLNAEGRFLACNLLATLRKTHAINKASEDGADQKPVV
ncbi:helix-turn-helix domain-containing protein [Alkalimonas mucilaginosa]|uniref:Helix-turn-helix transcriptional regulator n=1 Tax=Alkalimonas mucilaginosa TaxID=3057676 RepID=A0ABU7JJL5_9GAMM|nr:helix-turn-helix transcriptional regulator [Alkalimonas sp. MEB004]MEE2025892.1 helix-turn-helix transcriptional regulator [Alkalimonas sp. MEB004]